MEDFLGSAIDKVVASIDALHGDRRAQRSKHDDYMNFLRMRSECQRKILPVKPAKAD